MQRSAVSRRRSRKMEGEALKGKDMTAPGALDATAARGRDAARRRRGAQKAQETGQSPEQEPARARNGAASSVRADAEPREMPAARDGSSATMPLWERPGYLVRRLHQIHSAIFLEECKAFNITPVQYGLMTTLLQHSGSDQRTIGVEVGIDRTNVADVLERLSERGLVRRERSETDRRAMNAFLTEQGRALVGEMYSAMVRAQQRLLEPLDPEYRSAFLAMLTQLVEGNNHYSRAELKADFKVRRRRGREED